MMQSMQDLHCSLCNIHVAIYAIFTS